MTNKTIKGFLPKNWGPHAWMMLHAIALAYPDNPTIQDKENYRSFYSGLKYILPCFKCRNNLKKHSAKVNINNYLTNSTTLHKWITTIHNMANSAYGGSQFTEEKSKKFHLSWLQDPSYVAISPITIDKNPMDTYEKRMIKVRPTKPESMSKTKMIGMCIAISVLIIIVHFIISRYFK
jgi:hypothetical protein